MYKAHNLDDERFPPRQLAVVHRRREGSGPAPERGRGGRRVRAPAGRALRALRGDVPARRRRRFRRAAAAKLRAARAATTSLREHYQRRFSHLLVDEFQDTNLLQYKWLQLLAGPDAAVFAVGDDDQSIYAFRGANAANMQHFERDFGRGRPVRAHQARAELPLARPHPRRRERADPAQPHAARQEPVDERRQGRAGARVRRADRPRRGGVRRRRRQGPRATRASRCPRSRCSTARNAQSRVLEHALFNAGLPYRVYGGMRFFERAEVKHALAYLRLVADAGRRRRVPARRQLPAARHRRAHARAAAGRRARPRDDACGRPRASGAVGGKAGDEPRDVRPHDREAARARPRRCRCRRRSST